MFCPHAAEDSYNLNMVIPLHTMFLDIPLRWVYQHLSVSYVYSLNMPILYIYMSYQDTILE